MNRDIVSAIRSLHQLGRQVTSATALSDILDVAAESVARLLPADRVAVFQLDMLRQTVVGFAAGGVGKVEALEVPFQELQEGLTGWVLREGVTAVSPKTMPDARETPATQRRRLATHCGSIVVVPLRFSGILVGTMTAINRTDQADFSSYDVEMMELFADFCAMVIENTRLVLENRRTTKELEASIATFSTLFDNAPFIAALSRLKDGRISKVNAEFVKRFGFRQEEAFGKTTSELGINPDAETRKRFLAEMQANGSVREAEMELVSKTGVKRTFAVSLETVDAAGEPHILQMLHDITDLKALQEKLRTEASVDPLTQTFNRRHFLTLAETEVERAKRHKRKLSLIMADLDHFKNVNDTYGHAAGDQVLVAFSQVLLCQKREHDIVARLGGEEFLLLLPETSRDEAWQVAERIRVSTASALVNGEQHKITFTSSFGIAEFSENEDSLDQLMQKADKALYESKANGRNRIS